MNTQALKRCKALLYFDGSLPLSADNASPYGINDIHGFPKNVVLGWETPTVGVVFSMTFVPEPARFSLLGLANWPFRSLYLNAQIVCDRFLIAAIRFESIVTVKVIPYNPDDELATIRHYYAIRA